MLFGEGGYLLSNLVDLSTRWGCRLRVNYHLVHHSVLILLEKADASISPPVLVEFTWAGSTFPAATSFE